MKETFRGTSVHIAASDAPDLSRVTDMSRMFARALYFNGNISGWDTSSVTDMTRNVP